MKKRALALVMACVMSLSLLVGCGGANNGSSDGQNTADDGQTTYTIQLAGSVTEDHPITQGLYKFKELAESYSDGRITVQVFPNGQLGSNREFYEQVQSGNIQMGEAGAVILANFTDKFKFMQLPFLFNSREACQNFLKSEDGQAMNLAIAEECGLYPLVYFENGWQAVSNSKKEILTPADLKGLKIRTQENDILLEIYTEMGCNPTPMAFSELFTAMQQKTVDGQVNPALIAQTGGYYEVQKYITDVNAVYDLDCIAINYDYFKSLPQDLQDVVVKAANEARDYNLQLSANGEEDSYKQLADEGMTVTRLTAEQRAAFQDVTSGCYDWFKAKGIEPNLDNYLTAIAACNEKFTNGQLEAVTGNEQ